MSKKCKYFTNLHCCYDCPNFRIDQFEDFYDLPASEAGLERISCKDCYLNTFDCCDCLFYQSSDCPYGGVFNG